MYHSPEKLVGKPEPLHGRCKRVDHGKRVDYLPGSLRLLSANRASHNMSQHLPTGDLKLSIIGWYSRTSGTKPRNGLVGTDGSLQESIGSKESKYIYVCLLFLGDILLQYVIAGYSWLQLYNFRLYLKST
jgi:hypothetical protein